MLIQSTGITPQATQLEPVSSVRLVGSGGSVGVQDSSTKPAPTPEQVNQAVETINKSMRESNRSLEFSVSPDSSMPIVKLVDTSTGEVIRQIPTEESLAIAKAIEQFQQQNGMLLKQEA